MGRRLAATASLIALAFAANVSAQDTVTVKAGAPLWRSTRLVEEVRFGALEGADELLFGSVQALVVGKDGNIVVGDAQGPRLRMYSPAGKFIRAIGRKGAGPGEYRRVSELAVLMSGEYVLWDVVLNRISFFSPAGGFARSITVNGNWGSSYNLQIDTAGNLWVYNARRIPGPGEQTLPYYVRVSLSGQVLDTLWVPRSILPSRRGGFGFSTSEGMLDAFKTSYVFAPSPLGYIVSGYTNQYAITAVPMARLQQNAGRRAAPSVLRITRDYTPVPLNREERSEWQAAAAFLTKQSPRSFSANTAIPSVKPAFRGLWVDLDGRIWVDRYTEARKVPPRPPRPDSPPPLTWHDRRSFDVFEGNGRYLGTVSPPPNTMLISMRGNTVWGVTRGTEDEEYVVRYRLETTR